VILGGRYEVTEELGRGGMGRVLLARDRWLDREVAVKTLLAGASRAGALRFVEEAQVTGQIDHPNVVPVHELGREGDELFLVMKRVEGDDLEGELARLEADGPPGSEDLRRLLRLVLVACGAVGRAHEQGLVHRDLKPANVMVGRRDEVLVLDWGLARPIGAAAGGDDATVVTDVRSASGSADLTQAGAVVGTPAYMPPEQAEAEVPLDARADVYALGAVLYRILAGRPPYAGGTAQALTGLIKGPPPPPSAAAAGPVPAALEAIVMRAMARDREARYPDAAALAADLEAFLDGRAVTAHREGVGETLRRLARRHRVALGAAAASLVALLAVGVAGRALVAGAEASVREAEASVRDRRQALAEVASRLERTRRLKDAIVAGGAAQAGAVAFANVEAGRPLTIAELRAAHADAAARLAEARERVAAAAAALDLDGADAEADFEAAADAARRRADLALFEALVARDPAAVEDALPATLDAATSAEGAVLLARARLRLGQPEAALAALAAAPAADPPVAAAAALVDALARRAPLAERAEAVAGALAPEDNRTEAWLYLRRAEVRAAQGDLDAAETDYRRARQLAPLDGWVTWSRWEHLFPRLPDRMFVGSTIGIVGGPRGAPGVRPRLLATGFRFRVWARGKGGYGRRLDRFEERPLPPLMKAKALVETALGFADVPDRAIAEAEVLAEAPDDPEALGLRAELARRIGERALAGELTARGLERWPEDGLLNLAQGRLLAAAGRWAEAERHLALGARGSLAPDARLDLAECRLRLGDAALDGALAAAWRAYALDPSHDAHKPNPDLEPAPGAPRYPRLVAAVERRRGRHARAALLSLRAFQRGGGGRDLLDAAADHEAMGLPAEAVALYELTARNAPAVADEAAARIERIRGGPR